jgi:predicted O-methyltransferase YrrM
MPVSRQHIMSSLVENATWLVLRRLPRTKANLLRRLLPPPVRARHVEYSMIVSADDEPAQPSRRLIELAAKTVPAASEIQLIDISGRITAGVRYPDVWPGEHYRLLAALVQLLQPRLVVEIGTAQGLSALALKKFAPADGKVVSFDIMPWREIPETCLRQSDFDDGRLEHYVGDLSDPTVFSRHSSLLEQAEVIFVDAPKDGRFEPQFLKSLERLHFQSAMLLVLDDIRLWNMLATWRQLTRPKLDVTSFGHWSGTGLVDWTGSPHPWT